VLVKGMYISRCSMQVRAKSEVIDNLHDIPVSRGYQLSVGWDGPAHTA
jgi:hypothetical protein